MSLCTVSNVFVSYTLWDCHIASILSISNWIFHRILFAVRPPLNTLTFANGTKSLPLLVLLLLLLPVLCSSGVRLSWRMIIDFSLNFDDGKEMKTHLSDPSDLLPHIIQQCIASHLHKMKLGPCILKPLSILRQCKYK